MPVKKKVTEKSGDYKLKAFVAVFFSIIGFLVAVILWKKEKYVMFYAKESLVLFVGFAIISFFKWVFIVGDLLMFLIVILWVITWVYALTGKQKNTFIVGDIAKKIKL